MPVQDRDTPIHVVQSEDVASVVDNSRMPPWGRASRLACESCEGRQTLTTCLVLSEHVAALEIVTAHHLQGSTLLDFDRPPPIVGFWGARGCYRDCYCFVGFFTHRGRLPVN